MSNVLPINFGVPQGSILGPILFSLYVNDLPLYLKDSCELFCDDTTVHTSSSSLNCVSKSLQNSANNLSEWCKLNHMLLNPQKTKLMLITTRQKRQNLTSQLPAVFIDNQIIAEVDTHKVLGIVIDNNLSWSSHVKTLCKTISKQVYQLCKIKHFLNVHSRKIFLDAHILSSISYGSTLYDSASANIMKPLISMHKRAVKAVLLKSTSLVETDYKSLGILPLKLMFSFNKGLFMHKITSGLAPRNIVSKFSANSRDTTKLDVPVPRLDLFKTSLLYSGSVIWNSLPYNLRCVKKSSSFKKHIMQHFTAMI